MVSAGRGHVNVWCRGADRYRAGMAIIYRAELSPTKPEILRTLLEQRPWGEVGQVDVLGAYRFDDPEGEVGIECHLARVGETIFHLPLTYRPRPLDSAAESLISTLEHSVLGTRYVYDGLGDETALDCFRRALSGEQEQAELAVYETDGSRIGTRPQSVTLRLEIDEGAQPPTDAEFREGLAFTVARTIGGLDGTVRLVASWDGDRGVVAAT